MVLDRLPFANFVSFSRRLARRSPHVSRLRVNSKSMARRPWPYRRHANPHAREAAAVIFQPHINRSQRPLPRGRPHALSHGARRREGMLNEVRIVDALAPHVHLSAEHKRRIRKDLVGEAHKRVVAVVGLPRLPPVRKVAGLRVVAAVTAAELAGPVEVPRLADACVLGAPRIRTGLDTPDRELSAWSSRPHC